MLNLDVPQIVTYTEPPVLYLFSLHEELKQQVIIILIICVDFESYPEKMLVKAMNFLEHGKELILVDSL